MSKRLKDEQKSVILGAANDLDGVSLDDWPVHSTRADNFKSLIEQAKELGRKLRAEIDPDSAPTQQDTAPTGGDHGHGDDDMANRGDRPDAPGYVPPLRNKNKPGMSGFPDADRTAKDREKDAKDAGQSYEVDSTSHRQFAAGDDRYVNQDTLQGHHPDVDEARANRAANPKGRNMGDQDDSPNVSYPEADGDDTTNTSTDGAARPDNYFATHGGDADQPRKYDSANRVATETLGHERMKRGQEDCPGLPRDEAEAFEQEDREARGRPQGQGTAPAPAGKKPAVKSPGQPTQRNAPRG